MIPFILVGTVLALASARSLNALALGDDVARSLGQRVQLARALAAVAVVILCGAAVAAAGPIAFVGLTIPHVARAICGPDYRWVLPWSMVLAPILLLGADIIGRVVAPPGRAPGGHRHRPHRRAVLHRPRAPPQAGGALTCRLAGPAARPIASSSSGGRASAGRPGCTPGPCRHPVVLGLAFGVFAWSLAVGDFPIPIATCSPRWPAADRRQRLHRPHAAPAAGPHRPARGRRLRPVRRHLPAAGPQPARQPRHHRHQRRCRRGRGVRDRDRHGSSTQVTFGALAGADLTAVAIYLLAYKQGVTGYRLVLVGIGVTAMLGSVTSYLLTRAEIFDAQRATVWLTGSLNGRGWEHVRPVALALCRPAAVTIVWPARCGCSSSATTWPRASAPGSSCRAARCCSTATALAALATASAGPIGFVALVAPQIARRLVGGRSLALLPSAACGALLLVASDLVARRIFAPTELPVGDRHGHPRRAVPPVPPRPRQPDRRRRLTRGSHDRPPAHPHPRRRSLRLAYDDHVVVDGLSLRIPTGQVTVIVGANACGKSTLLRGLARLLKPKGGSVLLDGEDIDRLPTKQVATRLGILPQQPIAPEGITVADLVARGRHPHQRWMRQFSIEDEAAVAAALDATEITDLADRSVDELSGGQRQRVWIALTLAQGTPLMLLDEPTTFLDLAHQVEVLDLLADLNEREGRTIVLVLHDLNLACRYAHHLVAMKDGAIVAQGPPAEVITAELVGDVFDLRCEVIEDPLTGTPLVLPCRPATGQVSPRRRDGHPSVGAPAAVAGPSPAMASAPWRAPGAPARTGG